MDLNYQDNGYIRKTGFIFTATYPCNICGNVVGRGFFNKSKDKLTCLDCSNQILNIKTSQDLGFFSLDLSRKFSQFYTRYKQGKMSGDDYIKQEEEFAEYIHPELLNSIKQLVDLDINYQYRKDDTGWEGYWLGVTGNEINLFFSWLKVAIEEEYEDLIEHFKQNSERIKVPIAVREAQDILDTFYKEIKIEKRFKL